MKKDERVVRGRRRRKMDREEGREELSAGGEQGKREEEVEY